MWVREVVLIRLSTLVYLVDSVACIKSEQHRKWIFLINFSMKPISRNHVGSKNIESWCECISRHTYSTIAYQTFGLIGSKVSQTKLLISQMEQIFSTIGQILALKSKSLKHFIVRQICQRIFKPTRSKQHQPVIVRRTGLISNKINTHIQAHIHTYQLTFTSPES